MKKVIFALILIIIFIVSVIFINQQQREEERVLINKTQEKQAEADKQFGELVVKEKQIDPLMSLQPIEKNEFSVYPNPEEPYTYYVIPAKGVDKAKAKEAFEKWVKEKNLDLSHLQIRYE